MPSCNGCSQVFTSIFCVPRFLTDGNIFEMCVANQQLPDSVPPLDLAIALAAKKMRDDGMDPFVVPDSTHTIQRGMDVNIYDGRVEGLSTIHRSGDIVLNFENGTIIAAVQVPFVRIFTEFDSPGTTGLFVWTWFSWLYRVLLSCSGFSSLLIISLKDFHSCT